MLYVVTGPPAAGKSTWIRNNREPGSITIDFDELATTLAGTSPGEHDHPPHIHAVTKAARNAAIDAAMRHADTVDIFCIHSTPSPATLDRYLEAGARIVTIDPGKDIVMQRIKTSRPKRMFAIAAEWYKQQEDTVATPRLDWRHQKVRKRLMYNLKDGEPCYWCTLPLYRDAHNNWDRLALHADHTEARSHGGRDADRLLHDTCNKQRGNGDWDNQRPALIDVHPRDWTKTGRMASLPPVTSPKPSFSWS